MLNKFNQLYSKILFQHTMGNQVGFQDPEDLLETAYDKIGFEKFDQLKSNKEFTQKLNNTEVNILKDANDGLWSDTIQKYDKDHENQKNEAIQFYNYLKELITQKES